ncbi:MAG: hypothetical protein U0805_01980 [Pirellulales bacterium]
MAPRKHTVDGMRLLIVLVMLSCAPRVVALEWGPVGGPDYYDPARHNPFLQDPAFIAPTLDLSGAGIYNIYVPGVLDNYFWVTMVSDTYFITTTHTMGAYFDDYAVHFYHDNNPTPAESIAIDDTYRGIMRDDLWIGRLQSAPSDAVKRYPVIKRPEGTNYAGIPGLDSTLYIVGDRTGEWGEAQSRVGLNDISQRDSSYLYFSYDFAEHGVDEVRTLCCDSSAPSFAANPYGKFAVAGLHHDSFDINISSLASEIAAEVSRASGGTESVTIVTDLAGDLNADFVVDQTDRNIVMSNLGRGPGMRHLDGDVDGNGYVDNDDLAALEANLNKSLSAPADFNGDFAVNKADMLVIGNNWHHGEATRADGDANGDHYVDVRDFDLLNASYLYTPWKAPAALSPVPGDLTKDGLVDNDDSAIVLTCITSNCSPQDFARSDINNDSVVDATDLQVLLAHWDPTGPADVNDDLKINNDDIAVLFRNWGTTTDGGKADGDLNLDHVVNAADYALLMDWWGRGVADFAAQAPLAPQFESGDFNGDGAVDAADYVAWRKTDGSQAGYIAWRSHVGIGTGAGATQSVDLAAVPEPGSVLFTILTFVGLRGVIRRKRSRALVE